MNCQRRNGKSLEWREESGQEMRGRRRDSPAFFFSLLVDSGGQLVLLGEIRNGGQGD